jgi:hypothetical protein
MLTHRLVAGVTALVAQSSLVQVDEPSVPSHEIATIVNAQCLLNMDDDKVIVL